MSGDNTSVLIIGANSEIAKALAKQIVADNTYHLIVISRDTGFYQKNAFSSATVITVNSYQELDIQAAIVALRNVKLSQVFICNGLLHDKTSFPEKKLEDFSVQSFINIVQANTVTPMLWLKHLMAVIDNKSRCTLVFFSARVASIEDNHLGGWYSYRAAKTSLNMLLKSAAIELARRAKGVKLIAFHPGTTDSPLSKPFQGNVAKDRLFTADFVANKLLNIVANSQPDGTLSYLDWQGKVIKW